MASFGRERSEVRVVELIAEDEAFEAACFVGEESFALEIAIVFDLDFDGFDNLIDAVGAEGIDKLSERTDAA